MTFWYCGNLCRISCGGAGEFDDQDKLFKQIRDAHKNCSNFQKGIRKLKGKQNWSHTEIENEFTNYMNKNYDRLIYIIIQSYKGSKKSCLIRRVCDDIG